MAQGMPHDHADIKLKDIENRLAARLESHAQVQAAPGRYAAPNVAGLLAKGKELLAKYRPFLLLLTPDQYDPAVALILDLVLKGDPKPAPEAAPKANPAT